MFPTIVSQIRTHHDVGTFSLGFKKFHISHTIEHKICVKYINIIQLCMLSECYQYQISICTHDKLINIEFIGFFCAKHNSRW
jgi:hypothetical protein